MKILEAKPHNISFPIAIVISKFNIEITDKLFKGAIERLREIEFKEEEITALWVPGAVEIPLAAKRLAETEKYQAIICLGAVIRGETTHYDYVCQQVSLGCQEVALSYDVPVIFGVLTTEDEQQALERTGGIHGHKGRDAVDAAFEMVSVLALIE